MKSQKRYKFHVDRKELSHRYIELQQSAPDIAKRLGCSKRTILLRLREYQIPVRSSKDAHNIQSYLSKFEKEIPEQELYAKYIDEQLGMREIATLYNCSASGIRNNLRRYGIHIRTKKEAQTTPACIAGKEKVAAWQRTPAMRDYRRKLNNERYKDPAEHERTKLATMRAYRSDPTIVLRRTASFLSTLSAPLVRQKYSTQSKKYWSNPENRRRKGEETSASWRDPKYRANQVTKRKKSWQANNFEAMRRMMLANCISPNKPETSVLAILNKLYPNEWKFTGDGQVIIDGLNPDFINTNGRKLIIEVFGDYWHRQNVKPYRVNEGRVGVYAQYGYKTLIIWERETKNAETLKQKILEFVG